jgi:hypothetical protein
MHIDATNVTRRQWAIREESRKKKERETDKVFLIKPLRKSMYLWVRNYVVGLHALLLFIAFPQLIRGEALPLLLTRLNGMRTSMKISQYQPR